MKQFVTMFLMVVSTMFVVQLVKLARWPFRLAFTLACIFAYLMLEGCAK